MTCSSIEHATQSQCADNAVRRSGSMRRWLHPCPTRRKPAAVQRRPGYGSLEELVRLVGSAHPGRFEESSLIRCLNCDPGYRVPHVRLLSMSSSRGPTDTPLSCAGARCPPPERNHGSIATSRGASAATAGWTAGRLSEPKHVAYFRGVVSQERGIGSASTIEGKPLALIESPCVRVGLEYPEKDSVVALLASNLERLTEKPPTHTRSLLGRVDVEVRDLCCPRRGIRDRARGAETRKADDAGSTARNQRVNSSSRDPLAPQRDALRGTQLVQQRIREDPAVGRLPGPNVNRRDLGHVALICVADRDNHCSGRPADRALSCRPAGTPGGGSAALVRGYRVQPKLREAGQL